MLLSLSAERLHLHVFVVAPAQRDELVVSTSFTDCAIFDEVSVATAISSMLNNQYRR
jgi:hypothetical protein